MQGIPSALFKRLDILKSSDFEHNIPYMYVDSVGIITIGIGHNLTRDAAYKNHIYHVARRTRKKLAGGDSGVAIGEKRNLRDKATGQEIEDDFRFLSLHAGNGSGAGLWKYAPENMSAYTTLEMPPIEILRLFAEDLKKHYDIARQTLGAATFDALHLGGQAALVDIAYNVGNISTFPTLLKVIKGEGAYGGLTATEKWRTAARHTSRPQVSTVRNTKVSDWMLEGLTAK